MSEAVPGDQFKSIQSILNQYNRYNMYNNTANASDDIRLHPSQSEYRYGHTHY